MLDYINGFSAWVQTHGWEVVQLQVLYSCAVQALPEAEVTDSKWYRFFYKFAHTWAGNVRVVAKPPKGTL